MDFLFGGYSLKAGIYKLTNKINNRIYIGSTYQFKRRWQQHRDDLEKGIHSNKFLQNDFNKSGTDVFVFEIIDIIDSGKEDRLFVEQVYLDYYYDFQNQCYNLSPYSKSREGNYSKDPEKTRQLISKNSKEMWANPESRELIAQKKKEFYQSPEGIEAKEQNSNHFKNLWKSPEHQEKMSQIQTERMNSLTLEDKEKYLKQLETGRTKESYEKRKKQFREKLTATAVPVKETKDFTGTVKSRTSIYKNAFLLSPDGILYRNIQNLREFAIQNNLNEEHIRLVVTGKRTSCKQWIRLGTEAVTIEPVVITVNTNT